MFDHQLTYDVQIAFFGEPEEKTKEKNRGMDSITAAEWFWTWKGDIESEGKRAYTVLLFMEEGTQMVALTDPEGETHCVSDRRNHPVCGNSKKSWGKNR